MPAIIFGLGAQELIIIGIIILLLFGGAKLPQLMRGMGQGVKEFKDAVKDDDDKELSSGNTENSKS